MLPSYSSCTVASRSSIASTGSQQRSLTLVTAFRRLTLWQTMCSPSLLKSSLNFFRDLSLKSFAGWPTWLKGVEESKKRGWERPSWLSEVQLQGMHGSSMAVQP